MFYKTRLTENYDAADLENDRPQGAIVIATLGADGTLLFYPAAGGGRSAPGDTVIYYAPRRTDNPRRRARAEPRRSRQRA